MLYLKRFAVWFFALVVLVGATGISAQPAQASYCTRYHTVRPGETLSSIARYYGVSWTYLDQINASVRPPRYVVYSGQQLCVSTSGGYYGYGWTSYTGYYAPTSQGWGFSVVGAVQNTSVTIKTNNFPDNVYFKVKMGKSQGQWVDLPDMDTGKGGNFKATFNIPGSLSGSSQLILRLVQVKKNGKTIAREQWFSNSSYIPSYSGTGGLGYPGYPWYPGYTGYPGYYYGVIPTIWIQSVVRNSTVTIRTANFPAGLSFDVLMGPMGTRGVGGYYVGTLNSGSGGTLVATFNIPSQLYGYQQIAIRTQNLYTGYYSYNWFYNNTAY
jgi:LysM repeat protein